MGAYAKYGVNSSFISYDSSSFLIIASTVKAESTDLALQEIYLEIDKLCLEPIGQQELKTVKNYILGSLMRTIDGPFLIAEQYKLLKHKGKEMSHLKEFYDLVKMINSEELMAVASKYFELNSFTQVVVGNKSNN